MEIFFPSLTVSPAADQWQDEGDILLSFLTLELGDFETLGKKVVYLLSVQVSNVRSLSGVEVDGSFW